MNDVQSEKTTFCSRTSVHVPRSVYLRMQSLPICVSGRCPAIIDLVIIFISDYGLIDRDLQICVTVLIIKRMILSVNFKVSFMIICRIQEIIIC